MGNEVGSKQVQKYKILEKRYIELEELSTEMKTIKSIIVCTTIVVTVIISSISKLTEWGNLYLSINFPLNLIIFSLWAPLFSYIIWKFYNYYNLAYQLSIRGVALGLMFLSMLQYTQERLPNFYSEIINVFEVICGVAGLGYIAEGLFLLIDIPIIMAMAQNLEELIEKKTQGSWLARKMFAKTKANMAKPTYKPKKIVEGAEAEVLEESPKQPQKEKKRFGLFGKPKAKIQSKKEIIAEKKEEREIQKQVEKEYANMSMEEKQIYTQKLLEERKSKQREEKVAKEQLKKEASQITKKEYETLKQKVRMLEKELKLRPLKEIQGIKPDLVVVWIVVSYCLPGIYEFILQIVLFGFIVISVRNEVKTIQEYALIVLGGVSGVIIYRIIFLTPLMKSFMENGMQWMGGLQIGLGILGCIYLIVIIGTRIIKGKRRGVEALKVGLYSGYTIKDQKEGDVQGTQLESFESD